MATKVSVTWSGLDSFMQELHVLTADLVDEANAIMLESAQAAKTDIAAKYQHKTGRLRQGLVLKPARGTVLAGAELVSTAPHAYIYERGTTVRETKAGANRGRMRPTPTFFPIAEAYRRQAIQDVIFRLYQHGASQVSGSADEE